MIRSNSELDSLQDRWRAAVVSRFPEAVFDSVDGEGVVQLEIPENVQLQAWAEVLAVHYVDNLKDDSVHAEYLDRFPIEFSRQHGVAALGKDDNKATTKVAIARIGSWNALDVIGRYLDTLIDPIFAPEEEIQRLINASYQQLGAQSQSLVADMHAENDLQALTSVESANDLLESSGRPPVVNLVNSILFDAVKAKASDVHIQPQESQVVVRERIDGVLFDAVTIPKDYQEEVISRLKILGKMNIAEKRLPQDGRATVRVGDRVIDLRIASLPTSFGERVVVRFLDKSARLYTLEELGMDSQTLQSFRRLIKVEHGLLLVTGPTGGGKSTTLYAALQEINSKDLNVLTLEDPIEYQLDGISQTQINLKKGLTFASGLRNVLRQDPDIIMVGEIRDQETAVMAIQSALTGHLVFSTLHTNDAASAVTRLLDLGIEPFLVSSSVICVVAQRLVRRICPECRTERQYEVDELKVLGLADDLCTETFHIGRGCRACRDTGYRGRVGIFELLEVTDVVRDLIQNRENASRIRSAAVESGTRLLHHDGLRKAAAGLTTLDEVVRVTMCNDD